MRIGVIGAGTWGTALSEVLAENGNEVYLWHYSESTAAKLELSRQHSNLPSRQLHPSIKVTSKLSNLPQDTPVLIAVPTSSFHTVLPKLKDLNSTSEN